ncbi:MAG: hypothetical protein ACI81R_002561 [Bradymonadia bacterium]|jgi:hypothetical protein
MLAAPRCGTVQTALRRPQNGETMSDENTQNAEVREVDEQLIMCYISKQMVPISETVEVNYGGNKKYRVLPKFVKYSAPA